MDGSSSYILSIEPAAQQQQQQQQLQHAYPAHPAHPAYPAYPAYPDSPAKRDFALRSHLPLAAPPAEPAAALAERLQTAESLAEARRVRVVRLEAQVSELRAAVLQASSAATTQPAQIAAQIAQLSQQNEAAAAAATAQIRVLEQRLAAVQTEHASAMRRAEDKHAYEIEMATHNARHVPPPTPEHIKTIEQLRARIASLEASDELHAAAAREAQQNAARIEAELVAARRRCVELERAHEDTSVESTHRLARAEAESRRQLAELSERLARVETQHSEARAAQAAQAARCEAELREALAARDARVLELERACDDRERVLAERVLAEERALDATGALGEAQHRIGVLQSELEASHGAIDRLHKQIDNIEQARSALAHQCDSLRRVGEMRTASSPVRASTSRSPSPRRAMRDVDGNDGAGERRSPSYGTAAAPFDSSDDANASPAMPRRRGRERERERELHVELVRTKSQLADLRALYEQNKAFTARELRQLEAKYMGQVRLITQLRSQLAAARATSGTGGARGGMPAAAINGPASTSNIVDPLFRDIIDDEPLTAISPARAGLAFPDDSLAFFAARGASISPGSSRRAITPGSIARRAQRSTPGARGDDPWGN